MSPIAIAFGLALSALGGGVYAYTQQPTALIPAAFGIPLIVAGFIARLGDKARKHSMHFAAMIGLLGAAGGIGMGVKELLSANPNPTKYGEQLAMGVLCAIFVALCVKSFIDARKARKAAETGS